MSEAHSNPLHELHQQAEAEFQAYGDIGIVCTFGEPQAEYSAIRKGCALIDLPQRGILEVRGDDRLDFLNRFLTNQLIDKETKSPMKAGEGVYAFLLNNKGRIVADMNVLERGDRTLLETDVRNLPQLQSTLTKFVFSEKVAFASLAGKLHEIALHGPRAAHILSQLLPPGAALPAAPLHSVAAALSGTVNVLIWRDDPAGVPGYFLAMPSDSAATLWTEILSRFAAGDPSGIQASKRLVWPTGWAAFNATRIEAGRAMFGIDFDDTVVPAETGQIDRAVSFIKGCYLGQEIVARMHARGQAARQIVGIRMNDDALPIAGTPVYDPQQIQIGQITSSTLSPVLSNAAIAMAMVKKGFISPGTVVAVAAEGKIRPATIVALPFLQKTNEDGTEHV
jgi:folate-binding protein YgfZ